MNETSATVVDISARRMAPADYEREREEIRKTYGDSSGEAAALRDQALAKLFYRSGWTQEELAKKEGKSQRWVSYRTLFGRFLGFSTTGAIPRNLAERRFRGYWEQTNKSETNERIRFREVLKLMASETTLRKPPASVLDAWLKAAKEGELKEELKPAQYYQGCVYAWNAFREEKQIKDVRADTKKGMHQPV